MKYFIISYFSLIILYSNPDQYKWKEVAKPGSGSFQENWKQGKWPMALPLVTAFENKLWVIGQKNSWSSADGINWEGHTKTDWEERHGNSYTFFRNKLWMMGGMKTWDDFRNDIWTSPDGKNWEKIVDKASWQERRGHSVIVFKEKLWLIGGSGKVNQLPAKSFNDIWSSEDGITWIQELKTTPWPARQNVQILVFKDQLWMIGGHKKDVWSSPDGRKWSLVTGNAPWKERSRHAVHVFDNKIWLFGGVEMNDVWFSTNGLQWTQYNEHAPWSKRSTEYSISFKNKLWVFSGKTGREDSWAGDIWTLEPKPGNQ